MQKAKFLRELRAMAVKQEATQTEHVAEAKAAGDMQAALVTYHFYRGKMAMLKELERWVQSH